MATDDPPRPPSSSIPQFHKFCDLPYEIRREIWALALPSRVLDLGNLFELGPADPDLLLERRYGGGSGDGGGDDASAPPAGTTNPPVPLVARACREARGVALEAGRRVPIGWRHRASGLAPAACAWLDARRDVLLLPRKSYGLKPPLDRFWTDKAGVLAGVRTVAVTRMLAAWYGGEGLARMFALRGVWTALRTVIMVEHTVLRHVRAPAAAAGPAGAEPSLAADFAEDGGALVSLEDYDALERFLARYPSVRSVKGLLEVLSLCSTREGHREYVDAQHADLKTCWLLGCYFRLRLDDPVTQDASMLLPDGSGQQPRDGELFRAAIERFLAKLTTTNGAATGTLAPAGTTFAFDESHPWVADMLRKMPAVKLAFLVRLCVHPREGPIEQGEHFLRWHRP